MKSKMLFFYVIILIVATGCSAQSPLMPPSTAYAPEKYLSDPLYCEQPGDCLCNGITPRGDMCFVGNKYYHDRFIAKNKKCPRQEEFCKGSSGYLTTKCMVNECAKMTECIQGFGCNAQTEKCIDFRCVPK